MEKTCPKCNREFPIENYNWKNKSKGVRDSYCKACRKLCWDLYYSQGSTKLSHRKAVKKYNKDLREVVRSVIREAKKVPCADCGQQYEYYVMDLDHRPGETKHANVGNMQSKTVRQVRQEIAKCDVVCANCHRKRTHLRRGNSGVVV